MGSEYSKDISIPGERIGYLAVHPEASFIKDLMEGMALANRILGFVNAPGLMQRIVASLQGSKVDISAYARKKDILCNGLIDCGYDFIEPPGAFYLFPDATRHLKKNETSEDLAMRLLDKAGVAVVPGEAFGCAGHIRISFGAKEEDLLSAFERIRNAL